MTSSSGKIRSRSTWSGECSNVDPFYLRAQCIKLKNACERVQEIDRALVDTGVSGDVTLVSLQRAISELGIVIAHMESRSE